LNAALKNFLKIEIRNGDPAGRFVKDFRSVFDSPDQGTLERFLDRSRPKFDRHLIGIGGYAHSETVQNIVGKVADKYADEFNTTYTLSGEKLDVTNQKRFDEIGKESFAMIDSELTACGHPGSDYLKNVVLVSIFHQSVLERLLSGK
jgi:hypothetical protein